MTSTCEVSTEQHLKVGILKFRSLIISITVKRTECVLLDLLYQLEIQVKSPDFFPNCCPF